MNAPIAPRSTPASSGRTRRSGIDLSALALRHATVLRLAYVLIIGLATLLSLGFEPSLADAAVRLRRALDPRITIHQTADILRNIALFAGWGATWILTSRAPTRIRDVIAATAVGMALSLTVEVAQLWSGVRMSSVIDLGMNTLGSVLGALALWLVEARATHDLRRGTLIGVPAWLPAGALVMMAVGAAFAPPNRDLVTISWAASPWDRARIVDAAAGIGLAWYQFIPDAVAWIAAGLMAGVAISDRGGRLRLRQLVIWLLLIGGALWLTDRARALSGVERANGAAIVQALAALCGLAVSLVALSPWLRSTPAAASRAFQLAALAAVAGTVLAWVPAPWPDPPGHRVYYLGQLIPMLSLFQSPNLHSVCIVLQRVGLGSALGACLAARTRSGQPWPGVRAAIAVALVNEIGQFLVPGRDPDVTEVIMTSAAAGLVAAMVERAAAGAKAGGHSPMDLNAQPSAGSF